MPLRLGKYASGAGADETHEVVAADGDVDDGADGVRVGAWHARANEQPVADASGVGFDVDAECRAVGRDGQAHPALRLLGLPTLGHFGDTLGAMYIAAQIERVVPGALRALGETGAVVG